MAGVFLVNKDGLVELREQPFATEDDLQSLLERYPNLMPGDQINSATPRRWVLICREMGVASDEGQGDRWAVDHLFVDQDAIPTLVEVKRSSDTRIRREVVGQLLEYAANAALYWTREKLTAAFQETHGEHARERLQALVGQETDPDQFWNEVSTNLEAGNIRLVFLGDRIPSELRKIVEFLNAQMGRTEVLAIELRQYTDGQVQTLVPRVFGQTAAAELKKGVRRTYHWDETSFDRALSGASPDLVPVATGLREWAAEQIGEIQWGSGANGSFGPVCEALSGNRRLFHVTISGGVFLQLGYLWEVPPFDEQSAREEFLERLGAIEGYQGDKDWANDGRYPGLPLEPLIQQASLDAFKQLLIWALDRVGDHREEAGSGDTK
jgi:hypothetical protein